MRTRLSGVAVAAVAAWATLAAQDVEYKSTLPADHPSIASLQPAGDDPVTGWPPGWPAAKRD